MELITAVSWLAACFLMAFAARSFFDFVKLRFVCGAFTLYMGLGIGIVFWAVWFVCSATGLIFNSVTVAAGAFIIILSARYYRYKKGYCKESDLKGFMFGFLIFSILFLTAVFIKGYKPFIDHQTEQYMDFGFVNAMYRQQKVPFEDIWFANSIVNYYYLGQAAAAFMCGLSFLNPGYGYNYMLCTIFAALALSVFELVNSFLASFDRMKKTFAVLGGTVSALICSLGGNGHFIIYGFIKSLYNRIMGSDPDYSYTFPSSTLFIGCEPESLDRGKHEFPSYTLVIGDLHAHVINMLFTVPLMAVLIDYALTDNNEKRGKKEYFSAHIILLGLLLGLFKGVNYWDFPIYFIVCGSVILFSDLRKKGLSFGTVKKVLVKGLIIYVTGYIALLPFTLKYVNPSSGIHLCDRHSPLIKLIIIWFPFVVSAVLLLVYSLRKLGLKGYDTVIAITLCGLGLILLPEIIYVKDIYGEKYQRFNTMFKMTFQAFILLSVSAGIMIGFFLNEGMGHKGETNRSLYRILSGFMLCIFLMQTAYMPFAVKAWFGDVYRVDLRQGISSTAFIERDPSYDDVRGAVEIINSDRRKKLHIIEEVGDSYSPDNRLSVFTGASSVAGWKVHEWVWRNAPYDIQKRMETVKAFYESGDEKYCREVIDKYDIDYIYVGQGVKDRYFVAYEGFINLGSLVWENRDKGYMLIRCDE